MKLKVKSIPREINNKFTKKINQFQAISHDWNYKLSSYKITESLLLNLWEPLLLYLRLVEHIGILPPINVLLIGGIQVIPLAEYLTICRQRPTHKFIMQKRHFIIQLTLIELWLKPSGRRWVVNSLLLNFRDYSFFIQLFIVLLYLNPLITQKLISTQELTIGRVHYRMLFAFNTLVDGMEDLVLLLVKL